tara:strand:- start:9353 stop:9601 length:249 start_codon:yes stop_codon:yes gene_type:complete
MVLYTLTPEELTRELNKGKELYLDALQKEGILTKEKVAEISEYSIILAKKTILGSVWDKFFNKKTEPRYFVVKVLEQWNKEL